MTEELERSLKGNLVSIFGIGTHMKMKDICGTTSVSLHDQEHKGKAGGYCEKIWDVFLAVA
jgi:hypothetical protein